MKIVIGLGNPGEQYENTRHNAGFMAADSVCLRYSLPAFSMKGQTMISSGEIEGERVYILKPISFMNLSGSAIAPLISMNKISNKDVIVMHDDLDIECGKVKAKMGGSSRGHNGLRDIDRVIGSDYYRVRIGIGRPALKPLVSSYVLSRFSDDQMEKINSAIDEISENISKILHGNINEFVKAVGKMQL
ncbi:aminoacyl-tRNA hydrolase [Candidatus Hydrogenosomobacter endosymbioticus]|uniref:Peptidyl-tRNA hydrolase n=1 Tax=Candidatus Hydrogenosomobacter endosymbioticus TaxID=2558174 RepID=A0ABM7V9C5_9PROT|nr:aminoacyl-tRNA hydrolase [Candidatus Hydrogenosomobacter endosymbioticus]BDB96394.1 peptidyl-tRNA hydrolase [Candidatus Hydrogenosomobacter endosymbioticus]